ncbi:unnamed protein product [Pleuronectes platessa]|uniref:Uncharacterized protein n=1 Tax=Pleuronectes platessa TaxID=8262 RepID=A0A9N7V1B9_PLEPL|nr:unnamed protein product [Pleuronectes platessa]
MWLLGKRVKGRGNKRIDLAACGASTNLSVLSAITTGRTNSTHPPSWQQHPTSALHRPPPPQSHMLVLSQLTGPHSAASSSVSVTGPGSPSEASLCTGQPINTDEKYALHKAA